MSQQQPQQPLFFSFRGRDVPVTWSAAVSYQEATMTLESKPFQTWVKRIEGSVSLLSHDNSSRRQINIEAVELQSVDLFGARGVGFAKLKSHCTLEICSNHQRDGSSESESESEPPPSKQAKMTTITTTTLPGICLLRGDAVAILVALFCCDADDNDDNKEVYTLLVEQPRIPIGQVDCLELPAGMMDDDGQTIQGTAVKEMQEECGIDISPGELIDLTKLAFQPQQQPQQDETINSTKTTTISNLPRALGGVPPSQGGCDEVMRLLYLEKLVTQRQLQQMQNRLTGLRSEGEVITLRVVPYEDAWRLSADGKAIIARFLAEQLRRQGKIPAFGKLATPLGEPTLSLNINNTSTTTTTTTMTIPQLAFGCYKVPDNEHGESILQHAIQAGYRHFDTASFYGNEATLGRVLRQSGIPREKFVLVSKVWNDAQKQGRAAVRESVLQSIKALDFGGYWDLFLVHWPVPGHYIDTYHELETLQQEGKIKAIGLSNFSMDEYTALIQDGITVPPVLNQFEVSPFMYRPKDIAFFQTQANMVVAASKAMHRAGAMDHAVVLAIAQTHNVTPAQVMIRWSLQRNLVVLSMSSSLLHQRQNRDVTHFCLSPEEMDKLDSLTSEEAIHARAELEVERKKSM